MSKCADLMCDDAILNAAGKGNNEPHLNLASFPSFLSSHPSFHHFRQNRKAKKNVLNLLSLMKPQFHVSQHVVDNELSSQLCCDVEQCFV